MGISYSISSYSDVIYLLAPVLTCIAGVIFGLIIYYKLGEKYGVKTPKIFAVTGRIHLPLYLAIVIYALFMIFQLWNAYYSYGTTSTHTLNIRGADCFYKCYKNPWFYVWAAAIIAAVVLTVLAYKRKVNFAVPYIIIGVSFILFYFLTAFGAENYAINNIPTSSSMKWINNYCSPMCIIAGAVYIVCAAILLLLTYKNKPIKKENSPAEL